MYDIATASFWRDPALFVLALSTTVEAIATIQSQYITVTNLKT